MKKTMINNNEVEVVIHEQETAGGNRWIGISEYVVLELKDLPSMVGQVLRNYFHRSTNMDF